MRSMFVMGEDDGLLRRSAFSLNVEATKSEIIPGQYTLSKPRRAIEVKDLQLNLGVPRNESFSTWLESLREDFDVVTNLNASFKVKVHHLVQKSRVPSLIKMQNPRCTVIKRAWEWHGSPKSSDKLYESLLQYKQWCIRVFSRASDFN